MSTTPNTPNPPYSSGAGDHDRAGSLNEREMLLGPPPPAIRRNRTKPLMLLGSAIALAGIVLAVILTLDRSTNPNDAAADHQNVLNLIPSPDQLTTEELGAAATDIEREMLLTADQGGWIQFMKDGRLAQQYRCQRLDPDPPGRPAGWLQMLAPEIQLHLEDDRIVTLRGESALVHAPDRMLESGSMTGNVIVRLYRPIDGAPINLESDAPALEIRTPQASFDNIQGEVRCDDEVDIQTATAHLPGRGLRLQFNELAGRPEWLRIEQIHPDGVRLAGVPRQHSENDEPDELSSPAADVQDALTATPADPSRPHEEMPSLPHDETVLADAENENDAAIAGSIPSDATVSELPSAERQERRRAGRAGRGGRRARPAPMTPAAETDFYRLTFHRNVMIRQGDDAAGWTATGDELHVLFSLRAKGLGDSFAFNAVERAPVPHAPTSLRSALTAMLFTTAQPSSTSGLYQSTPDEIILTCDGGLTMAPLVNAADRPVSPDDARFELIGNPVHVHDAAEDADIRCAMLTYRTLDQRLELISSDAYQLTVDSPSLHVQADRFWLHRPRLEGAFEKDVRMTIREAGDDAAEQFNIACAENVNLSFAGAKEDDESASDRREQLALGKLRRARFNKDVNVTSAEFTMTADSMTVTFPVGNETDPGGASETESIAQDRADELHAGNIESILAEGSVVVRAMDNRGTLRGDALSITFMQGPDGQTIPSLLTAMGNVEADEPGRQTIWSDGIEVTFIAKAEPTPSDSTSEGIADAAEGKDGHRGVAVHTFSANDNVQVLMADGSRAYGDRIVADAVQEAVTLSGTNVVVVSENAMISGGSKLTMTQSDGKARWEGPGIFEHYTQPIGDASKQPVPRPTIDPVANPRQLHARWSESMIFDSRFNDGVGAIVLQGDVNAESTPTIRERNTMTGQTLALEFMHAEAQQAPSAPEASPTGEPSSPPAAAITQARRQLQRLIAEGDARLESRAWLTDDHSDLPRVFFVTGQYIEYDDQALEALIRGEGQLLVRDEWVDASATPADAASEPPAAAQPAVGSATSLSAKGTTAFKWSEKLELLRRPDGMFDIQMRGNVEVIHRDLQNAMTKLNAPQLDAIVKRAESDQQRDATFDLGGAMELQRIHGAGGVYIDAPTRDIDCYEFEYDYATGLASLSALPGRSVIIRTAGTAHVLRAEKAVWEMKSDTVSITKGSGGLPR